MVCHLYLPYLNSKHQQKFDDLKMEWKPPPLHRHLSTIGIGPIFICPPPHSLPQPVDENHESIDASNYRSDCQGEIVDTWEIIGDIKATPSDFLVREIGWAPPIITTDVKRDDNANNILKNGVCQKYRRKLPGWSRKIAGLDCHSHLEERPDSKNESFTRESSEGLVEQSSNKKRREEEEDTDRCYDESSQPLLSQQTEYSPNDNTSTDQKQQSDKESAHDDENPSGGLKRILTECVKEETTVHDVFQQLTDLQTSAINALSHIADGVMCEGKYHVVWIPTAELSQNQRDWKLLHQYVRMSFPFLKTEASSVGPSSNKEDIPNITSIEKSWIRVLVDETFFSIAPLLAKPSEDLRNMYRFRNIGPVAGSKDGNRAGCKRRNENNNNKHTHIKQSVTKNDETNVYIKDEVLLRLRPDLPRNERRIIHQALTSNRRRDFETSTKHDIPLNGGNNSENTTAISVQWSRGALQGSRKKRKRNDGNEKKSDVITAIFCVLRKEQCEHQVAVNKLAHVLKCRVGDIGMAGIKDMQAVTYQFCTLRNVDIRKVHRMKDSLGSRLRISDFVQVYGVDALLDRGKLIGSKLIVYASVICIKRLIYSCHEFKMIRPI